MGLAGARRSSERGANRAGLSHGFHDESTRHKTARTRSGRGSFGRGLIVEYECDYLTYLRLRRRDYSSSYNGSRPAQAPLYGCYARSSVICESPGMASSSTPYSVHVRSDRIDGLPVLASFFSPLGCCAALPSPNVWEAEVRKRKSPGPAATSDAISRERNLVLQNSRPAARYSKDHQRFAKPFCVWILVDANPIDPSFQVQGCRGASCQSICSSDP